jgi:glutamine cyclotransferase
VSRQSAATITAASLAIALLGACTRDASEGKQPPADGTTPTVTPEVVRRGPHDPTAFTQGLEFHDSTLYESTGLEGQSTVRHVNLATGAVRKQVRLPAEYFGEGITVLGGKLYQLTWKSERGFVYDAATLAQTGTFEYDGEGWGLTNDGQSLIMSNGTNTLRFLDPTTFQLRRTMAVTDAGGYPVTQLNELEWVRGEIWANVWQSEMVARIDPATGRLTG